jgi:hypothetical protein
VQNKEEDKGLYDIGSQAQTYSLACELLLTQRGYYRAKFLYRSRKTSRLSLNALLSP